MTADELRRLGDEFAGMAQRQNSGENTEQLMLAAQIAWDRERELRAPAPPEEEGKEE